MYLRATQIIEFAPIGELFDYEDTDVRRLTKEEESELIQSQPQGVGYRDWFKGVETTAAESDAPLSTTNNYVGYSNWIQMPVLEAHRRSKLFFDREEHARLYKKGGLRRKSRWT